MHMHMPMHVPARGSCARVFRCVHTYFARVTPQVGVDGFGACGAREEKTSPYITMRVCCTVGPYVSFYTRQHISVEFGAVHSERERGGAFQMRGAVVVVSHWPKPPSGISSSTNNPAARIFCSLASFAADSLINRLPSLFTPFM